MELGEKAAKKEIKSAAEAQRKIMESKGLVQRI